ncbi:DUF4124 domain-containing protein [Salinicola sp. JS01]|uniref:DUF4124 domain-containing protein n=1 Tax=Salinicola sp. JS01 TaxID=3050071 RepID=UPI00255B7C9F|nr:DUF4124 domain-containing protein [Salinicola sp. JS01]WIX32261.1 DUF4124 domain-containing protein [Salinicola sp. JS01]
MAGVTVAVMATGVVLAAPVYRHIDAQGNVVYSDRPASGERVELAPISVVDPQGEAEGVSGMVPSSPPREASAPEAAASYTRFEIASPADGTTLPTGRAGDVQVRLAIQPPLADADRVQLRVDGEVRQSPMRTQVFAVSGLARGEHQLLAEIVDPQGQVQLATPPVTLYVQRASVNLPANPNRTNGSK